MDSGRVMFAPVSCLPPRARLANATANPKVAIGDRPKIARRHFPHRSTNGHTATVPWLPARPERQLGRPCLYRPKQSPIVRRYRESGTTVAVRVQQDPLGLARSGCVSIDKGTSGILITTATCELRPRLAPGRPNPIRVGPNMDGPGRASSRLASDGYISARAKAAPCR